MSIQTEAFAIGRIPSIKQRRANNRSRKKIVRFYISRNVNFFSIDIYISMTFAEVRRDNLKNGNEDCNLFHIVAKILQVYIYVEEQIDFEENNSYNVKI